MAKSKNSHRSVQKIKASKRSRVSDGAGKQRATVASEVVAEAGVVTDRRSSEDRRKGSDRRQKKQPVAVERRKLERRTKVARRRQIDPTTCERDYTGEEIEFMNALDQYKRSSGRMFPTCSEILEVLKNLGYKKELADSPEQQTLVPMEPVLVGQTQPEPALASQP